MDYEEDSTTDDEFFECCETQDDTPKTLNSGGTKNNTDTPTSTPSTATNRDKSEVTEDIISESPIQHTEPSLPDVSSLKLDEDNVEAKGNKDNKEEFDANAIITDVLAEAENASDDENSSLNPGTLVQEAVTEASGDPKAPPEFTQAKEKGRKKQESCSESSDEEELTEEELKERTERTKEIKERGNERFKNGEYEEAKELYTEGLQTCPKSLKKNRSVLFSNRSACLMKLDKNEEAVKDCSKAINLHPTYLKAILRRAELFDRLEKYEEAQKDYETVIQMDPSVHAARVALLQLPAKIEQRNEKLKAQMMTGLKDLGNIILRPFGLTTDNFQMQQDPNTGSYNIQFNNNPGNGPNGPGS